MRGKLPRREPSKNSHSLLSTMALPLARLTIQRQRERQLRIDLWKMRDAIDRYKDMADRGGIQTKGTTEPNKSIWSEQLQGYRKVQTQFRAF